MSMQHTVFEQILLLRHKNVRKGKNSTDMKNAERFSTQTYVCDGTKMINRKILLAYMYSSYFKLSAGFVSNFFLLIVHINIIIDVN